MKKIRCPKCDDFIIFDEKTIDMENVVVFKCQHCGKSFKVKFKRKNKDEEADEPDFGSLVVVENIFAHKQVFKLHLGDNVVGRRNPGDSIDCPIVTTDPSMDREHCVVNVSEKNGNLVFRIRDCNSNTGTFVMNVEVTKKEQRIIHNSDIISLGATTLILKTPGAEE
ncbi:MAG: FHA domain-containing protein [Paludibacteraceae bacterium]|nr:FHA domain-containing protein [Paludibacteraceae bacterium]